ncbi:MAG: hypothetical protein R3C44_12775 [Chloroflexota bacterium]
MPCCTGDFLDVYISGHYVIHPFITRLRFHQGNFQSARVMVTSLAPFAPDLSEPRGVTVNNQNVVMTTLPITGQGEFVYVFNGDFPEGSGGIPARLFGGTSSLGMTADAAGNFYISSYLSSACGNNEDFIIIPANLSLQNAACFSRGDRQQQYRAIAVNPSGNVAYLTQPSMQRVIRWTLTSGPQQSLSPVSITLTTGETLGGASVPAVVTLLSPASSGGATISLTSNDPSVAAVPSQVKIPAGQTSTTFTIHTKPVQSTQDVTIRASFIGDATVTLRINPVRAKQFLPANLSLP